MTHDEAIRGLMESSQPAEAAAPATSESVREAQAALGDAILEYADAYALWPNGDRIAAHERMRATLVALIAAVRAESRQAVAELREAGEAMDTQLMRSFGYEAPVVTRWRSAL